MEKIILNDFEYNIKPGDFPILHHNEYNNLKIYPKVGELERLAGLLNDLSEKETNSELLVLGWSYGGFIPIECSKVYKNIFIVSDDNVNSTNIPSNILFKEKCVEPFAILVEDKELFDSDIYNKSYILCNSNIPINTKKYIKFKICDSEYVLNVPIKNINNFYEDFWYYLDEQNNFKYDNLIHLCIMVKNGGELFEKVLTENLSIIDRWTILDTGSTDGTQDIIRKVLKNKKGKLYEEPFINFRESRNKCLDLAGNCCKYILMLDDTYVINNDLRKFLNIVRGDQFATSFSLLIKSNDSEYYSNRIIKSNKNHRYIYTIHEVIQNEGNKENVVVPENATYIMDYYSDYMEKRTMNRKQYDLEELKLMVKEDVLNPRHYYYLGQTYNLIGDYENAVYWFKKRATTELNGHIQEVVDSWFEYARILNFKLNKPWSECKAAYEEAYKLDPSRPESLYFIGIHYFLEGDKSTAYEYFKIAFEIGYPIHAQFSLKPTLVYHFLPKFLSELCYEFKNWELGYLCSKRFLENNKPESESYMLIQDWFKIFSLLQSFKNNIENNNKPIIVFVADGGWNPWTGSDIISKGVGGSETYIIEIAKWIQASNKYNCVVFCNCSKEEIFEGVRYISLNNYPEYIVKNKIHTVIVSRYSEYIPVTIEANIKNIYLVLHDLGPSGIIIPLNPKLKKVICLTDWHVNYFIKNFPQFINKTESFNYGIDNNIFKPDIKIKNSFIYSSFPNRGLLPLLQMWSKIKEAIPDATLNVYSDINGKWVNKVAKEQMDKIREILKSGLKGVTIKGWVSKKELAKAWSKADIWFYPCIFQETFCLTALEAAITKTLAISIPLAALQETIGDRGILIEGNPFDSEWIIKAINEISAVLSDNSRKEDLITRNYNWANELSWRKRGEEFIRKYIETENNNENNDKSINNGNMYNWTHDLPLNEGSRKLFEDALKIVNPKRILEIGTYAGTSLIEMLKLYPEAKGVAIDSWLNYDEDNIEILNSIEENDIENIFNENIKNAELSNRVISMKGDSVNKLCELIEAGHQFDFIYVDGSHKCLNYYTDMVIAWQLLCKGGILAVDDILYNYNKVQNGNLLGYPLMAKKHFMDKYAGQYTVISDSYRLFISKN